MNKIDFINEVAKRTMISNYAIEEIYNVSFELAIEMLISGEDVEIPKLGVFKLTTRKEREGQNLFNSQNKTLAQCTYPTFKISALFKNRVKNAMKYPKYSKKYR